VTYNILTVHCDIQHLMRGDCCRSIGSPHVMSRATARTTSAYRQLSMKEMIDESHELPTPSWRLWVARPDSPVREVKSLLATRLEPPVQQGKAIVSSLIGERPQIRATAAAVQRRPGEGAGVGQRGAEGSSRALGPVPLLSRRLHPFARALAVSQNRRGVSQTRGCCWAGPVSANELEHQ